MEGHVTFVAVSEITYCVLGPLVSLGEKHAVTVFLVHVTSEFL